MQSIPDNTLAHYERLPQCKTLNLSKVNCQVFAENIRSYKSSESLVKPEREALEFYLFNHLASLIKKDFTTHEVMPDWACDVMREYKRILVRQGVRITAYLSLICVRESRHLHTKPESWWKFNIVEPYGEKNKKFNELIHSAASDIAVVRFLEKAPSVPIGAFFGAIETIFFKGSFSQSFGGKAWGKIANCLNRFISGQITQEMLVDTAYTLAHNGGPIFNKGMLYNPYSSHLITLLDIQRSGQIPELIRDTGEFNALGLSVSTEQYDFFKKFVEKSGHKFGDFVDWKAVTNAGAVGKYASKHNASKPKPAKSPGPQGGLGGWAKSPVVTINVEQLQAPEWFGGDYAQTVTPTQTFFNKKVCETGKLFYIENDVALSILERIWS